MQRSQWFVFLCFVVVVSSLFYFSSEVNAGVSNRDKTCHVIIESKKTPDSLRFIIPKWEQELNAHTTLSEPIDNGYGDYCLEQDKIFVKKSLAAEGYYQSNVDGIYDESSHTTKLQIDAGQQYRFGHIVIVMEPVTASFSIHGLILKAKSGDVALAANVLADEEIIKRLIEVNYCFFTYHVTHQAVINHLKHQVDITYYVTIGPKSTFGEISFDGQKTIADLYLQRLVGIKPGECFQRSRLNEAKVLLQRSGLVEKVEVILPDTPASDGNVPVIVI